MVDQQRAAHTVRFGAVLPATLALLFVTVTVSLFLGSNHLSPTELFEVLWRPDDSVASTVLHEQRMPRALLAVLVGASLGVAGALMQSMTRNPLADPGVLGINAGAGFAVVTSVALLGYTGISSYVWFAFIGAAIATCVVYVLGSTGRASATPVRLALAGVAISAALTSLTQGVILADQVAFNEFRVWVTGSLQARGFDHSLTVLPFIVVGLAIALVLAPALNALALGTETGAALGVRVRRTRVLTMVAVVLLAGAGTAAVGPISFVGLAVPFAVRAVVGSDQRKVLVISALLGPVWLLASDIVARLVLPEEAPAGVVAALLGAPVFVAVVRRPRVAAL